MKRTLATLCAGIGVLLAAPTALAEPPAAPTRSIWLAPTYQVLFGSAFGSGPRHGFGASFSYEFRVSARLDLGLAAAYRIYPASPELHQLGYGAVLKHFFSADWATAEGLHPYVDYGLLLQQSFVSGRSGAAVSHDTRLGVGFIFRTSGIGFFAGAAGHYSRIGYFDVDSRGIPYAGIELGWVHGS